MENKGLKIADRAIGHGRTYFIAEVGNNHNGSLERAKQLVDLAVEMGADCVKFQMRHLEEVYRKRSISKSGEDLGTEYILDLLNRFELTKQEHRELADYCKSKSIPYLCTPWDLKSIEVLESFGVPAYKVASADLTNLPLISALCRTRKPLILSTGMSSREEICQTVDFLNRQGTSFVLLHCNSTYPAPLHDINLLWMNQLKDIHPIVGYSGHERGINVSLAAVALGATVVERHLTLDRNMEGPDHAASLEVEDFRRLIAGAREIETSLGNPSVDRMLSQGEMINRENLGKSLVAAVTLKAGTTLREEHLKVRSPGQGLSPQKFEQLIGRTLQRDMAEEDFFFPSDIADQRIEARQYKYKRPWGIPVRFHDFEVFRAKVKPDLFEFHLSYADMDLKLEDYFRQTYDCDFVVHAPELFSGSHLMDLATPDESYRRHSLQETQRVIDITRALNKFFPKTSRPMIVANVGGISRDGNIDPSELPQYYQRFGESMRQLDTEGVEIIPQTMAPFPWHFGGQRFQNIFVKVEDIEIWCRELGLRMCFDVSHSLLTCNFLKFDFYEFAERIAPFTAHLHLGDAKGLNGEGLQVGDGELDFERLGSILRNACPSASFIPEIWQGHKNGGEGFWTALDRLEDVL